MHFRVNRAIAGSGVPVGGTLDGDTIPARNLRSLVRQRKLSPLETAPIADDESKGATARKKRSKGATAPEVNQ